MEYVNFGCAPKMGFTRGKCITCVYLKESGANLSFIALCIDDMLIACYNEGEVKSTVTNLNKFVEGTDLAPIKFYLGLEIERGGLQRDRTIHQGSYVKHLLN